LSIVPTLTASIKSLETHFTKELHNVAKAAGWPEDIYSQLRVVSDQDGVGIRVPMKIEKEVGDLEYGIIGGPAAPVLRKFANHISQTLANNIVDTSLDRLVAEGVIP
jgi:hypothetical protein